MAIKDRPAKRAKLMSDDEASSSESEIEGQNGVKLPEGGANGFTINEEYAKRFEHNKKREEQHRLEEKLKTGKGDKRKRDDDDDDSQDDSEDETEDDDAELATADLDQEIMTTLQAIKNKDPKVYDQNIKFYKEYDPDVAGTGREGVKKEKPMYLQDYHRQNLLAGGAGGEDEDEDAAPLTYQQEQDALKRELVGSMHATANGKAMDEESESEEDDFLVAKKKQKHEELPAAPKPKKITDQDIATADKDPETFLSNFMAARAWLPGDGSRFQALDSDDSEDDKRAEEFEEAYNMRFEDPNKANEKLLSFARDVGKYSVRREEQGGRKAARAREREKKDAEKREREEDRARLRRLKIDEAEEKVKRIKEAAGLRGKDIDLDQWRDIIEGDFNDDQWDQEMQRRFGEQYYAENEGGDGSDEEMIDAGEKKRKAKKPKWDDDIDIKDLVPDFRDDQDKPDIALSSEDEADGGAQLPADEEEDGAAQEQTGRKRKTKKDRMQEKADAKRTARKERMKIEEMVEHSLPLNHPALVTSAGSSKAPAAGFRYRDTSPTSFGLSARDILFADDSALNQYAGLKKLTAFRDADKKRKDKKKLSKKARLREWRKETFGAMDEPSGGFEKVLGAAPAVEERGAQDGSVREGESKKRRRHKKKQAA